MSAGLSWVRVGSLSGKFEQSVTEVRTKYAAGRCTQDTAQPVPHCIPLAIVGRVTVVFRDKPGPSVAKGQFPKSA